MEELMRRFLEWMVLFTLANLVVLISLGNLYEGGKKIFRLESFGLIQIAVAVFSFFCVYLIFKAQVKKREKAQGE